MADRPEPTPDLLGLEVPAQTDPVIQRDVIVIGASAGGVQALQSLVSQLPPELPASVLVVLHLMSAGTSVLDSILGRAGQLPATQARDGERLERGHIYCAPPDFHMLLRGSAIHLSAGPRENGHRPAIDPLFRSAARAYGPRVIGLVLTGTLDDGTDGLRLIKERGGATVVQDPDDAAYGDMPRSAIRYVGPDRVVPLAEMGSVLLELVDGPRDAGPAGPAQGRILAPIRPVAIDDAGDPDPVGEASLLTCPDCGGGMRMRDRGDTVRFECQVGHAYSLDSFHQLQGEALEHALWSAVRNLEERADLLRQMARRAERGGSAPTFERLNRQARLLSEQAVEVRRMMKNRS
jgi:two-component system chemotaxis response regulator CheB